MEENTEKCQVVRAGITQEEGGVGGPLADATDPPGEEECAGRRPSGLSGFLDLSPARLSGRLLSLYWSQAWVLCFSF